jgi:sterol desaturase/sphingolipid hydroxylase (fatty acid hydroxylase superfamily)
MAGRTTRDPTVVAVPFYFATMAVENRVLKRRARAGRRSAGEYERRDTIASLSMGTISLLAPMVSARLLRPLTPGRGRFGRALVTAAVAGAAATTLGDLVGRRSEPGTRPHRAARWVSSRLGVATTVTGGLALATFWQTQTSVARLWRLRTRPPIGGGALYFLLAVTGWDFIYYWNHRLMHECRYMWAIHVVHHSSERYNLSTALRQPVLDAFGTPVPYGLLCLAGLSPAQVETARGVNLLYQYWIHTETIGRLGPAEVALNTPSHHRVHHGSNPDYIDRNHGSILIVWDRLFRTFRAEHEAAVYGLTKNIRTFRIGPIATHEFRSILRDVSASTSWRQRLSFVGRGPGWAERHRATELDVPVAELVGVG